MRKNTMMEEFCASTANLEDFDRQLENGCDATRFGPGLNGSATRLPARITAMFPISI
jgi:hypothetical protein